jgi:uroporphyrinogen decarboxylase
LDEVIALPAFESGQAESVAGTIKRVRAAVPDETAVIGFCGSPVTLLAYLLEGGGSKDFMTMRAALRSAPEKAFEALSVVAQAMNQYLRMQITAGADAVQVFDSWVGVLGRDLIEAFAVPSARQTIAGLEAPTIYFGPHAPHGLDLFTSVGATGYGIDWRTTLSDAHRLLGDVALQGNLDPSVLFAAPDEIEAAVAQVLADAAGTPGHIFNLGHGIDRHTDPDRVALMVEAVRK